MDQAAAIFVSVCCQWRQFGLRKLEPFGRDLDTDVSKNHTAHVGQRGHKPMGRLQRAERDGQIIITDWRQQ